jgi:hypothetical protein
MALVIDALNLIAAKKRLPTEAFFVDTNVLLDYQDPFGRSLDTPRIRRSSEEITKVMQYLRSQGVKSRTISAVALEYYKHIQVGFYQVHTDKKFDAEDFKKLRNNNIEFMDRWDSQISIFKKLFTKTFPLCDVGDLPSDLLSSFKGSEADFGDHLLWKSVQSLAEPLRCIFSGDNDFYSFPDEVFLLTINQRIIESASADGKLFDPDRSPSS